MKSSARVLSILCLIGIATTGSNAGTKWQKQEEKKPEKLICYECNSLYDSRCADPFDPYTLGYVDCNLKDPPGHLNNTLKPILCRKTVQKVDGKIRVIRGCGYLPEKREDNECTKRLGTHNVQVTYCACKKSFCNGAHSVTNPSISLKIATALIVITKCLK
ncbi:hypothetical protein RN001_014499 [Aquatica leii]|uniref:Protein sleepless n=1 Tax=Aquatica leii TaxID=1421715 RepID=A0AAN7NUL8_9COLE|nr:hypothetical protein RN001_014499 [Aquatica leii]